jgi:hypothetical protein
MVGAGIDSRGYLLWDKLSQRHEKCPYDITSCGHMKHTFLLRKKLFHVHVQNNPVDDSHFFSLLEMQKIIPTPG